MLEALPAAQSAGQKAQEDAQLGQGSIFDFGERRRTATGPAGAQAQHRPPISAAEFDRAELLALEKETLGTYLSSHPLTEVRRGAAGPGRLRRSPTSRASPTAPG